MYTHRERFFLRQSRDILEDYLARDAHQRTSGKPSSNEQLVKDAKLVLKLIEQANMALTVCLIGLAM